MSDWDVVVIGSGLTGAVVAKELSERGCKVLVLERGATLPAETAPDRASPDGGHGEIPAEELQADYAVQSKCYALNPRTKHLWVKDSEHPYLTSADDPFLWFRGYHVGGRSLTWARLCYRLSSADFEANLKDGHGVDWPIRYDDLAPWYDRIERLARVAGTVEGLSQLPDGSFAPGRDLNPAENRLKNALRALHPARTVIPARLADSEFSSLATTLPAAIATGNAVILDNQVVSELDFDERSGRVKGVRTIHAITREPGYFSARIVFVNASAVATAAILLNSRSEAHPSGLANRSGQVGRNLMDHVGAQIRISGLISEPVVPGTPDMSRFDVGYLPRYSNLTGDEGPFQRGFAFQVYTHSVRWNRPGGIAQEQWRITLDAFGEVLPYASNRVTLDHTRLDALGMPMVRVEASMRDNEHLIVKRATKDAMEMLQSAGFANVTRVAEEQVVPTPMGDRIHEMGTARMGRDPLTSVLNAFNQAHDVENLFISDGACMTSSGVQNPSLTYMALSARAAHYAADLLAEGRL